MADRRQYPYLAGGSWPQADPLHVAIDDATGIVTAAIFRPTEDLWGYLMMMEKGIRQYGVPLAIYSDQHTIFFSPQTPLSIEQEVAGETDVLTQFGAALSELGIEHIRARTPQAKERIERLWETFQGRLLIACVGERRGWLHQPRHCPTTAPSIV